MKCPTCNFENSGDSKFCCGCGRPIPLCPTCGNVLTTRDRFCIHDGTRLPDELLMLVPEEEIEQVEVGKKEAPVVIHSSKDTVQIPVQNTPTDHCLRCGSPIWQGEGYCAGCRSEMQKAKPVCASCGMPCEPGEDYCSYCRPTDPVPVENMDYMPQRHYDPPAKKKKGSAFTVILVILLLLLIGAAVVFVAAEFELIELPDIFSSEDSGSDRDRDRYNDDDDDDDKDAGDAKPDDGNDAGTPSGNGGIEATTAPTAPAETTAPTTAPTTEATQPTTQPTQPAQTKLEYFMENCDSVLFTKADIAGFTKADARYARNACYAQAGRKFKDKALQAYYEEYYWYRPSYEPSYFDQHTDELMNDYERKNLKLIRDYEQEMGFD